MSKFFLLDMNPVTFYEYFPDWKYQIMIKLNCCSYCDIRYLSLLYICNGNWEDTTSTRLKTKLCILEH